MKNKLEKNISYVFKNKALLSLALTHSSLTEKGESVPDNERLEFLGDSVLGLIVSYYLYNKYPDKKEGDLSIIKNFIVKKEALSKLGRIFEIKKYLKVAKGLDINDSILENTVEAIIGAIFLDSDYYIVEKVVVSWIDKYFEKVINSKRSFKNPITRLKELSDKIYQKPPKYILLHEGRKNNELYFEMYISIMGLEARAKASTKKKAKELLALDILKQLRDKK